MRFWPFCKSSGAAVLLASPQLCLDWRCAQSRLLLCGMELSTLALLHSPCRHCSAKHRQLHPPADCGGSHTVSSAHCLGSVGTAPLLEAAPRSISRQPAAGQQAISAQQ